MVTTPLTTLTSASTSLVSHIRRTQSQAAKIQAEVASGRLYDVGQSLGYATESLVTFRQEIQTIQRTVDINNQVASRLDASQAALDTMISNANGFLGALMSARGDPRAAGILVEQAKVALKTFVDAANTEFGGVFLFSGTDTAVSPFENYFATPPPASRAAMSNAFMAEFGFSSSDPAVSSIPVSSMQAFMDNAYVAMFDDPNWAANWSAANSETVTSLVSEGRTVSTSVSANEDAFRSLMKAFVLVADAGTSGLNDATFEAVVDRAVKSLGQGVALMSELQGNLGSAQQEVKSSIENMSARSNILNEFVGREEGVDLSELSVSLNSLLNQLEATYAVTGRLQKLTLLDAL